MQKLLLLLLLLPSPVLHGGPPTISLLPPPPQRSARAPAYASSSSTTICMANPRRVKMVAKKIRRELSHMLLTDKVIQFADLPEYSLGADRYLSSLTTIRDVEVSADLQVTTGG